MATNGHRAPKYHIYRNYRFLDKDPIIDKMRTMIQDEGIREDHAALISDLSPATTYNWFHGATRKPQFSSIAALTHSLGYDMQFVKQKKSKLDVEAELAEAAKWLADRRKTNEKKPKRMQHQFKFD